MTFEKIDIASGTWRAAWRLITPYWRSPRNGLSWFLLAAMFACSTLTTYTQLLSMMWTKQMVDAFTSYNSGRLLWLCVLFLGLGIVLSLTSVLNYLFTQWLTIRWRTWLTGRFLGFWLKDRTYYKVERDKLVDNPDQRISEDLGLLIQGTFALTVGFYGAVIRLVTFSSVLWTKAGSLKFQLHGQLWVIPGYMFWCAVLFSIAQLWIVHLAGRAFMRVNYVKQRVEGDFRFGLTGIRAHPEQIAMYDGGPAELRRMGDLFEHVRQNMWSILFVQLRFDMVRHFLENISGPLPLLLAAPGYFSKAMTFGDVSVVGASFGVTVEQFGWFVRVYQEFQMFRVVVARLDGLERASSENISPEPAIDYARSAERAVSVQDLSLRFPGADRAGAATTFTVAAGERWMVRGKSGVGKSTLMRALAGIWPYGSGSIRIPAGARLHFVPQRAYVPYGTLKTAICYPLEPATVSDEACRQALIDAQLADFVGYLHEVDRWGERLSLGEQQRLAVAGALIQRPDFLFLDEATSALDSETEIVVYKALLSQLPGTGVIHVSHHAELEQLHDHVLHMSATGIANKVSHATV
jgi:vitamin B12/bleomycin/antimicrobial peptide transport system ATP-binding/permease protein